jgi:cathepsin B
MVNLPTLSLLISGASAATRPALTDALISSVNQNPNHTWTAGRNAFFEHLSLAEATATLLRIDYDETTPALIRREKGTTGVGKSPLNFDSRTQFPGCIGAIRNQLHCGACWAFAAAEVLSDRFCIASNGSINVTLAPQDLISCGHVRTPPKYMLGCDGGVPEYAWKYLEQTGISTDDCMPFIGNDNTTQPTEVCPTSKPCDAKKYQTQVGSSRLLDSARDAAQQYMSGTGFQPPYSGIRSGGPLQAVFYVYEDFFAYKSGVYKHTNMTQSPLGKHSIKLVGYGIDPVAGPYWTAANSWGNSWGRDGYFKIGSGECMIESEITLGSPLLE